MLSSSSDELQKFFLLFLTGCSVVIICQNPHAGRPCTAAQNRGIHARSNHLDGAILTVTALLPPC